MSKFRLILIIFAFLFIQQTMPIHTPLMKRYIIARKIAHAKKIAFYLKAHKTVKCKVAKCILARRKFAKPARIKVTKVIVKPLNRCISCKRVQNKNLKFNYNKTYTKVKKHKKKIKCTCNLYVF